MDGINGRHYLTKDMSVNEKVIQVNGWNQHLQSRCPWKNVRITNAEHSSDNNNANVNPRVQQTNQTVIYVDDDDSNADDDNLLTWRYLTYSTTSLMDGRH